MWKNGKVILISASQAHPWMATPIAKFIHHSCQCHAGIETLTFRKFASDECMCSPLLRFCQTIVKIETFMRKLWHQFIPVIRLGSLLLRIFLSGILISCLVIRFLLKDGSEAFAVVYYCTPLPVLAIFSLLLGIIWLLSKRIRVARACFIFTLVSLMAWSYKNISLNTRTPAAKDVKLLFWNAANNRRTEEITSYIQNFDADIIGFVEAGIGKKKMGIWKAVFPNHDIQILPGDMALLTKGGIISKESGALGRRGRYNLIKVVSEGKLFHVLLVDIDGDPLRSRAPAFEQLAEMIRAYGQTNLIVMGDFNTPLDSVLFDPLREYLTHAFESGGKGFSPSWPVPLPVLVIDHIWVSKRLTVVDCNLSWSRFSDHRSVVAHIEPPTAGPIETGRR